MGSGQPRVWTTRSSGFGALPHLFHPQRKELGVGRADLLPLPVSLRQQPAGTFGDDRHPGREIGRLGIVGGGLAAPVEPRRRGAHAANCFAVHQQTTHGKAGKQIDAETFGTLPQPANDLADRRGVVVPVVHRRRRRNTLGPALGHEVHRLGFHRLAKREVRDRNIGEQLPKRAGVDHRAREIVLAQAPRLFQHGDVEVARRPGGQARWHRKARPARLPR